MNNLRPTQEHRRAYTIGIEDAGRLVRLPALLIELGLGPDKLIDQLARSSLVVRARSRGAAGARALADLGHSLGLPTGDDPSQPGAVFTGCVTIRELEQAIGALEASSTPASLQLGVEMRAAIAAALEPIPFTSAIGDRQIHWGQRTLVMGIINVTPDSFSGDGAMSGGRAVERAIRTAVEQALAMEEDGADILDVGAESTRPGALPVDEDEELRRLIPVIVAIRESSRVPLSVDTYKSAVARAALSEGADMINDIHGMQRDAGMAATLAASQAPVVLMHNRLDATVSTQSGLGNRYVGVRYPDLMLDVIEALADLRDAAQAQGIEQPRLFVDPGLGFGKTVEQSLRIIERAGTLRTLRQPLLLGPSRKSFVGYTLGLPPEQRTIGTVATLAYAVARCGADIVRVHDVRAGLEAVTIADAALGATQPSGIASPEER